MNKQASSNYLTDEDASKLDDIVSALDESGYNCHLVGSALHTKAYRDIDVLAYPKQPGADPHNFGEAVKRVAAELGGRLEAYPVLSNWAYAGTVISQRYDLQIGSADFDICYSTLITNG